MKRQESPTNPQSQVRILKMQVDDFPPVSCRSTAIGKRKAGTAMDQDFCSDGMLILHGDNGCSNNRMIIGIYRAND